MTPVTKNLSYIKKEINDVMDALINNESYEIIMDSYENYNKSMLDYMKTLDKLVFKYFFGMIEKDIKEGATLQNLKDEYGNELTKELVLYIFETIFSIEDNDIEDTDDEDYEEDMKEINIDIKEVNDNFKWRKNQLEAINNTINQNFDCGIHNQIMGSGKTFIILKTIWEHYKLNNKNKKIYVITCFRQEILKDLFFDEDGDIDEDKEDFFKQNDIIDLDKFNIINRVHQKDKNVKPSKKKPSILIVNTDYLKSIDKGEKYINYSDINFVILDECHSVSANKFYQLLRKIKYIHKKNIIGFSATPLRDKAGTKLLDIFSRTNNDKDIKKLNIISNYDFINAIKDDVILPPYYTLCEVNKTLNGKIGKSNKDITKRVMKKTLKNAPYKKIIGWCKSKEHLKTYYKYIKENFPELTVYCSSCFDKELKSLGYNTNWYEFSRKERNCILLCINRGREGSDIKNLDTVIYFDFVKNRSLLVALQTAGRGLRKDKAGKKTHGIIIDTFINVDGIQIEQLTAKRIIHYYQQIFTLCDKNDYIEQKEAYEQMMNICNNIVYDNEKEELTIKLSDDKKHDMKIKLELTTKSYDFSKLKVELGTIIDKMFNVEKKQKFDNIIEKLRKINWCDLSTKNFLKAYDKISNKNNLGLPETSKILYDEYKDFINVKSWYELMNLDTSCWYPSLSECKKELLKIYNGDLDDKIYNSLVLKNSKIPINPYELYKLSGFKSIKTSFGKSKQLI